MSTLTPAQFDVLLKLVNNGGTMTMREWLATGRTGTLNALQKRKYVARSYDEKNPGTFLAWLTDLGANAFEEYIR